MDSSKTALAVLCGAVGGCILGAGYMLWREHHRGHGHGPFTEGEFDNIWAHTQYGEEEKELMEKTISFKEGLEYYSKIFELCSKYKNESITSRALDVGCSLGRTTFDLALLFDEVIGIDTSVGSIEKANKIKEEGQIAYKFLIEGEITKDYVGKVNPDIDRNRVSFIVGDACDLPSDLGQFGMIIILNALHHFPDPKKFLLNVHKLLVSGGILILDEMYVWHDMLGLPKDRWVSGYVKENGEEVLGIDGLKNILSESFELLETKEIPSITRWKTRMCMIGFSEASVWKRK